MDAPTSHLPWSGWRYLRADYTTALRKLESDQLLTLCRLETREHGGATLTICGTWRVETTVRGAVPTFATKNHATGLWVGDVWTSPSAPGIWRRPIPFWPVAATRSLDWVFSTVRIALALALGYAKVDADSQQPDRLSDLAVERINVLLHRLMRRQPNATPHHLRSGGKAIIKALYSHFIERDVLSVMTRIRWQGVFSFYDYVHHAARRDVLLRIARERPNLMPLLESISKGHWARLDLFGKKLWVRGARKRTLVDQTSFIADRTARCYSFSSAAGWRWVCAAPRSVVRAWVDSGRSPEWATILSEAKINQRVPVIATAYLAHHPPRGNERRLRVLPATHRDGLVRAARVFLMEAASIWDQRSLKDVREWLNGWAWQTVLDYLFAEGLANGFPSRRCTWNSLCRRSTAWHHHQRTAMDLRQANATWSSAIEHATVDGIRFESVTTGRELLREGIEQHHCVGMYVDSCAQGDYRVFRGHWPDGTRSTVGLVLHDNVRVQLDQHMLPYNRPVNDLGWKAATTLAALYRSALSAS